jgi:hypothetical protein
MNEIRTMSTRTVTTGIFSFLLLLTTPVLAAGLEDALTVSDDNALLFNGKPVSPELDVAGSLSVGQIFTLGFGEAALVVDQLGEACPAKLWIVAATGNSVKPTPKFGTCTDLYEVKQAGDTITITMAGFLGPASSRAAQAKAAKEHHVFVYKNGALTENGKPVS